MKCLYLHVGTPKTGTSTLQHFFRDNKEVLQKKGISYPEWSKAKAWGGMDSIDGNFGWIERCNLSSEQKIQEIANCFEKHDAVLLSTENIWLEVLDKKDFLNSIKQIDNNLEIKVIVYLRKQVDYLESQYRECIRLIPWSATIDEVCDFDNPAMKNVKDSLDYLLVLDTMAEAIGEENIIVRCYEKGQFKNGNIIEDFLDILGLELTEEFILPPKNYNPSMSNSALELKRYMNRSAFATQKEMNDCFYDILMRDGVEKAESNNCVNFKTLLSYDQRQQFMERFEECNRQIAYKYLHREDGVLFRQTDNPEMKESTVSTEDLLEQLIRVFTSTKLLENRKYTSMEHEIAELKKVVEEEKQSCEKIKEHFLSVEQDWEKEKILLEEEKNCLQEQTVLLRQQLSGKQAELDAIKNGYSWKITAPLRKIRRLIVKNK